MNKRLYKSEDNRVLCGVCGGLGEFLGIDATIIRLIWVLLCLAGGSGLLIYIIAAIVIPRQPID
jgi:phage shock protein C